MTGDTELDEVALEREAVRLRKSFERIKSELRRMAEAQGLIEGELAEVVTSKAAPRAEKK